MVQRCAVLGCNTIKAGDGVSLHGFPLETGMRSSWLRALIVETGQHFREEDQICSKHFTPDCFEYVNGLAVLKIEAIPFRSCSVNIETPTSSKRVRLEEICFESQKRSQKRSFVWEYFTRQNETIATCHLCNKELKYFGSTSNLREHMKRIHPGRIDIENIPNKDNNELTTICNNSSSPHFSVSADLDRTDIKEQLSRWTSKKAIITRTTVFSGKEKEDIDMSLVKMLVVDYQPLRMVDDSGFQAFVRKLQPWYTLPTKEILSSEIIPGIYEKMNVQLRHLISDVLNVAISAEIWTHSNRNQYLTLTSHFICEGQMINAVFATKKLPISSTIEYIRSLIYNILIEWEIQHKVVCIVTDCEIVVQAILSKQFVLRHQLCIAYTLNLCLNEVLNSTEAIKKLLSKCKNIMHSFKQDRKTMDAIMFNNFNKEPQICGSELDVKSHASINWQDMLKMLQKLIQQKEQFSAIEISETFSPETIYEVEWSAINELVAILKLIEDFAKELSSTKYPPVSSIIPLTRCLRHAVEARKQLTEVGKSFQLNLCNTLSQRLGGFEMDLMFSKATFLDPRFKKAGFGSVSNAEKAQQEIINELSTMMVENVSVEYSSSENQSTDENDIWAHFDQKVAQLKSSTTPKSNAELIVKHYIEVPLIPRSQDPFEYWDINKDVFPELYKLHIKYCCCPATSIAPESLFTKQGKIIKDRKTRLSESSLEKMLFLNGNIILFN